MALPQVQKRIERSIFEAIRKVLVLNGYLPDISDTTRYPEPFDQMAQTNWDLDKADIVQSKGFSAEVYNHRLTKGSKIAPRIDIISRRSMAGEIGAPMQGIYVENPADPQKLSKLYLPFESSTFYYDIHLVSASAEQDRVLNAIVSRAIGMKSFLTYYDDNTDRFLIRQYNYFDLPDPTDGLEEKVYSYEIPDVFDVTEEYIDVPLISEITIDTAIIGTNTKVVDPNTFIGPYTKDGLMRIDLSGINFNA